MGYELLIPAGAAALSLGFHLVATAAFSVKNHKHNAEERLQEYEHACKERDEAREALRKAQALLVEPGSGTDIVEAPGYDGPAWGSPPGVSGVSGNPPKSARLSKPRVHECSPNDDFVTIKSSDGKSVRINVSTGHAKQIVDKYNSALDKARVDVESWKEKAHELELEAKRLKSERASITAAPGVVVALPDSIGVIIDGYAFTDRWERFDGRVNIYRNTVRARKSAQWTVGPLSGMSLDIGEQDFANAIQLWCSRMNRTLLRTLSDATESGVYGVWTFSTHD